MSVGPEDFGGSDFDSGFESGWDRQARELREREERLAAGRDVVMGSTAQPALVLEPTPAHGALEEPEFTLSEEQKKAFDFLENGTRSIFLTGNAGCGKTALVNYWLDRTKRKVARTASTGIAATHIDGQTIHSWAFLGKGDRTVERIVWNNYFQDKIAPKIREAQALIIDEASMMGAKLFSLLDAVCRFARSETVTEEARPFGGLQLVLVGDMGQICPVNDDYCFTSKSWWEANPRIVELRQVHRQKDVTFSKLLSKIRTGVVDDATYAALSKRVKAFDPNAAPEAVRIMTHNEQAGMINGGKLAKLPGKAILYEAKDSGPVKGLERLDKECLAPRDLRLKVGARVMFVKNAFPNYANGTLGTVTSLIEPGTVPDGTYLDRQEKRADVRFDEPESPIRAAQIKNETVMGLIRVKLDDGTEITVSPAEWESDCGEEKRWNEHTGDYVVEKVKARRVQYPLRLAWSITSHKMQGVSCDRVSTDISRAFAPGQVYVALSRARTIEGLNIESRFPRDAIRSHIQVKCFLHYVNALREGVELTEEQRKHLVELAEHMKGSDVAHALFKSIKESQKRGKNG